MKRNTFVAKSSIDTKGYDENQASKQQRMLWSWKETMNDLNATILNDFPEFVLTFLHVCFQFHAWKVNYLAGSECLISLSLILMSKCLCQEENFSLCMKTETQKAAAL